MEPVENAPPEVVAPRPAARVAATYRAGAWLFLRTLGLVHLVAFTSIWSQISGLLGRDGILPAGQYLAAARAQLGTTAYWQVPTLCWLGGTGLFLSVLCFIGTLLALLLLADVASGPCLVGLWICYLSLVSVGQNFLSFQWDTLLLETTLLACFVAPWTWWRLAANPRRLGPPAAARWLLWWLLARLMFLSGVVKLTSGDPTWRGLTALQFHFETQPLPTWLGWYAHLLPAWSLQAACVGMFVIELGGPFLLFGPRLLRHAAALAFIGLMALIALTGNYTFFNLLTVALCLPCLDDRWWAWVWPPLRRRLAVEPPSPAAPPPDQVEGKIKRVPRYAPRWLALATLAGVVVFTTVQALPSLAPRTAWPTGLFRARSALAPLRSLNNYGLFMVMTTTRSELVIEGTNNGFEWLPYEFRWKPGDLKHAPGFIEPFQPRLDWQMWFAALGSPQQNPWIYSLLEHLLRGTPAVTSLFSVNPFPKDPPQMVRIVRYTYQFTDAATRAKTGQWWQRGSSNIYVPGVMLPDKK